MDKITICKYNIGNNSIKFKDEGIVMVFVDKTAARLRVPPRNRTHFIHGGYVAVHKNYIYIPLSQVERGENISLYKTPEYVSIKECDKKMWYKFKSENSYFEDEQTLY